MKSATTTTGMRSEAIVTDMPRPALIDPLRVAAAYLIIWIHTPRSEAMLPTVQLARFAVPFFVGVAIFLVVRTALTKPDRTLLGYVRQRIRRIYVPFLAWSAVYIGFKLVKKGLMPDQPNEFPGWETLFFGAAYHLWFLPFVLAAGIAVFALVRWMPRSREALTVASISLCLAGALMAYWIDWSGSDEMAAARWHDGLAYMIQSVPSVIWATSLALAYSLGAWRWLVQPALTRAALVAFVASALAVYIGGRSCLVESVSGILLLVVAIAPSAPPWADLWSRLAPLSYGVYLAHVLVIKVCETGWTKLGWHISSVTDIATFFVAAVVSTVMVSIMQRFATTRWLVG